MRVLVADDDRVIRQMLQDTLEARGMEVVTTGNGLEALQKVVEEPYDAVMLDIVMPGMNGMEVCRRIKDHAQLQHIPVLVMTSLTQNSDLADGFWRIGTLADEFITKPCNPFEIADKIEQLISKLKPSQGIALKS